MKTNNLPKGNFGENSASSYLLAKGYQIIFRNFRCTFGEIDIIAIYKNTLIFIEVKTRWSDKFGTPEDAVTKWKIKAIEKTGEYFKLLHPNSPEAMRIDVITISFVNDKQNMKIEHFENVTG